MKTPPSSKKKFTGFDDTERAAIKARTLELKAEAASANGEKQVLAAIAKLPEPDKSLAKKVHAIVRKTAPQLIPKTWYGFPAYANKAGKIICFFQYAAKFKYRYSTIGFQDSAKLDDGNLWPVVYAVTKIGPAEEKKIVALVKQAIR